MTSHFPFLLAAVLVASSAVVPDVVDATEPRRRNVVLITCDDLNTALGCYGHPDARTPHLDALATRGARFTQAFAAWPSCAPSRFSLLSGWSIPRTGITDFQTMPRDGALAEAVYLPQHFLGQGYATVRLDKVFHIGADDVRSWSHSEEPLQLTGGATAVNWTGVQLQALGLDGVTRRWLGPEVGYVNPVVESGRFDSVAGERGPYTILRDDVPEDWLFDGNTAKRAIEHLDRFAATGEPFFLAVGFRRPHLPFIAQQRYFDLYPVESITLPAVAPGATRPLPDDDHRRLVRGYLASVSFVDAQVGKVMEALCRTGLDETTVVVLLGDHGYAFGEREGWFGKGRLWDSALRTALIIVPAGGLEGGARVVDDVVDLLDVYPTVCELAGVGHPGVPLDGRSLVPLMEGHAEGWESRALSYLRERDWPGQAISLRTATHRYVVGPSGDEELIDVHADPWGWRNLAHEPSHAAERERLAALLAAHLASLPGAASPTSDP